MSRYQVILSYRILSSWYRKRTLSPRAQKGRARAPSLTNAKVIRTFLFCIHHFKPLSLADLIISYLSQKSKSKWVLLHIAKKYPPKGRTAPLTQFSTFNQSSKNYSYSNSHSSSKPFYWRISIYLIYGDLDQSRFCCTSQNIPLHVVPNGTSPLLHNNDNNNVLRSTSLINFGPETLILFQYTISMRAKTYWAPQYFSSLLFFGFSPAISTLFYAGNENVFSFSIIFWCKHMF